MTEVAVDPLLGVGMHAIGAFSAAACYTPQKKVRGWSWQSFWLVQATFCWLLLPILGAYLTIPDLLAVLHEAPTSAMRNSFLLGIAYGIGGTAFGVSIRYLGFSLTYAIAVGVSSVFGTLIPPLVRGTLGEVLHKPGSIWIMAGIVIGILGIAAAGWAGRLKEHDLAAQNQGKEFSLTKGLLLALFAGVLSAVYGFALEAGEPIAAAASAHGAGVFRGNVVYIFSNSGAYVTTSLYCWFLHVRHKTASELVNLPAGGEEAWLPMNFGMAALTGLLWYGQFFFYNLGHVRMGAKFAFSSWAIHMIMLALFSNVLGVILKEWRLCRRATHVTIALAIVILIGSVLALTYGNQLAGGT